MQSRLVWGVGAFMIMLSMTSCEGCFVIQAGLTSRPAVVGIGRPVTLDVSFTNISQCPLLTEEIDFNGGGDLAALGIRLLD